MGNQFPDVNERIRILMNECELTSPLALAVHMFEKGLLPSTEKQANELETVRNYARTIRNHVTNNTKVDIDWLDRYCRFFGCTMDYLFYGNTASSINTRVLSESTGLSLRAAAKLKKYSDSFVKSEHDKLYEDQIEILSRIIESDLVLNSIYSYCRSSKSILVQLKSNDQIFSINSENDDFIIIDGKSLSISEIVKENRLKKLAKALDRIAEDISS